MSNTNAVKTTTATTTTTKTKEKAKDTTEQRLKDHILLLETIADCERCITKFRELRSVLK